MQRLILVLVVLSAPLLSAADADDVKKDLKAMTGTWKMVGGEAMGKSFPKDGVPDFAYVMAADGKATGKMAKSEFSFTMSVDPTKTPKNVENSHTSGPHKGMKQYGIYKLEGDKLTVCMSRAGKEESDRPKNFTTKDTTHVVFIFERVKAVKKP